MSGRTVFDGGVKTQSCEAVKSMIEYFDGSPCERMPAKVLLANGWQLTKSSKGDCYYVTSAKECSCPGFHYRRTCRHVASLAGQKENVLPTLAPAGVRVPLVDLYAFDTTEGEIEYWQQKEAKLQQQPEEQKEEKLTPTQVFARDIVEAMEA